MAHLVDAKQSKLIGDYIAEIKGDDKKLTAWRAEAVQNHRSPCGRQISEAPAKPEIPPIPNQSLTR